MVEEISSWSRVQAVDVFSYYNYPKERHDVEYLKQLYIKGIFETCKQVFIVKLGFNFRSQNGLERLLKSSGESFNLLNGQEVSLVFLGRDLFMPHLAVSGECIRGRCHDSSFNFRALPLDLVEINKNMNAAEYALIPVVQTVKEGQAAGYLKQYCNLIPREDILYSNYGQVLDPEVVFDKKSLKIGLLTLTRNQKGVQNSPLFTMLLPSLAKTISVDEAKEIQIIMYLGYDAGDPVFDSDMAEEMTEKVQKLIGDKIKVKYHRLPRVNRLTLLWNILAFSAYRDGCSYFFQINDDSILLNSGWAQRFISSLQKNNDLGVVGPNDNLWECKLITQAFVSRKHFEIFGWLFPPQIRDWYSDNWITFVYGKENTFCSMSHKMQNGIKKNYAKRYMECDAPKWKEAIEDGKTSIKKYLQGV